MSYETNNRTQIVGLPCWFRSLTLSRGEPAPAKCDDGTRHNMWMQSLNILRVPYVLRGPLVYRLILL